VRINIVDIRVLAPGEWLRRRNMLPSCRLANGFIGSEHVIELQSGEWVHGRNILWKLWLSNGCMGEYVTELSLANGCVGGTCYRVEDWRIDVSTEYFTKL